MKISLVIPNYNGGKYLLDCLKSIYATPPTFSLETILIDNASTDNSPAVAKKKFPQIQLIRLSQNYGFSRAVNAGIKKAKGDYVLLLNNDIRLTPTAINALVKTLESNPRAGIVGGKMVDSQGRFCSPGFNLNPYLGFTIYNQSGQNTEREVDWLSGAAMMIKKSVFSRVGLFDEKFFFYFEDTDFCLRVKKAGFKIIYQPRAKILHLGGLSSRQVDKNLLYTWWYRGKFRCLLKNGNCLQIITSLLIQSLLFPYKAMILHDGTGTTQIKSIFWARENLNENGS